MAGLTKNQLANMVVDLRAERRELQEKVINLLIEKDESREKKPLPKKGTRNSKRMRKFKKLLDDPKSAWRVIEGGKGGVR